jgi:hypothetical protein
MLALRELQRAFADAILAREPLAFAPYARAGALAAEERVQLYQNNVFISLTAALADVYPVVQRLVGEEFFAFAARRYVRLHPSRSGNLHDFGRELPGFLAGMREAAVLPYLADVARLEWAQHEVFHAADAGPLDVAALAVVPESQQGRLRFGLHPAVRLVQSAFPILAIWSAHQRDEVEETIDLDAGADHLLVARRGFDLGFERISGAAYALLAALAADAPLADACERALAVQPDFDLAAAMGRFVADRTLASFHL